MDCLFRLLSFAVLVLMDSPWPAVPLPIRFPNETAPDVSGSADKTGAIPET
jgi:hypothetical protein